MLRKEKDLYYEKSSDNRAGAAGMTAAITAASNGAEVVVLEHMDRVGKKFFRQGTDDAILQILIRIEAVITLITNHFHGRSLRNLMQSRL